MSPPGIWTGIRPHTSPICLLEINRVSKTILIVVTHSAELAARFPKSFELVEGKLTAR